MKPACSGQDPELFFPEGHGRLVNVALAKAVCRGNGADRPPCPLIEACLEIAMRAEGATASSSRWGIFGGLDPDERAALARRRYRHRVRAAETASS